MLIKKPGAGDASHRSYETATGRAFEAAGSQPVRGGEPAGGTSQLDAMRDALGGSGLLERGHVLQGRYEIEQVLGIGGMSAVYRARDLRFVNVMRYCAVKEMPDTAPDPRTGELRLATFEREASLLATLNHPGIVKIYDFFAVSGRVYLILEYIEGRDLESVLEQNGRALLVQDVLRWSIEICEVLSYLHRHKPQPIVFRDLKPSNIMISAITNKAMIIDFGIAKLFQSDKRGTMIGTEGYSPPEQYRGMADPRVDIYALGATIHHLVTNSDPRLETPFTFQERMPREINPSVPPQLEAVIMQALEYSADRRWQTADSLKVALEDIYHGLAAPTGPAAPQTNIVTWPSGALNPPQATPGQQGAWQTASPVPAPQQQMAGPIAAAPAPAAPVSAMPAEAPSTTLLWSFAAEDEIRSGAMIAKGIVFVGSYDSNIYALNSKSGEFLWKYSTEAGICTVPALANDLVLIGSEDHSLYGLDAARGALSWRFQTSGPIRSSPRLAQYAAFFGSDDQHVYCVDARNGNNLWKYRTWGPVRSTPAIGRDLVYAGLHDGNLYALEATSGQMKWKFRTNAAITAAPYIHEGLVLIGSADQYLYAIDADNGWAIWKFQTAHYVNSPATVDSGKVYVGSIDGNLFCIDLQTGRQVWKFNTGSQIISGPRTSGTSVYFGAADGSVYCLNRIQGELKWRFRTGGAVTGSPVIEDGMVYAGSFDHKLYALAM